MSDPRATPGRSSKTAAVFMLVVFLQVLVVAVLGLGAISRDRREARRLAEEKADREARLALDETVAAAGTEVEAALSDVRSIVRSYEDLEFLRTRGHRAHADLVGVVYQVDPDTGEVLWLDGDHRLFVPPLVRATRLRAGTDNETDRVYDTLERDAHNVQLDDLIRFQKAIQILRRFPYRQKPDGYPEAVGIAREFVDKARAAADWRSGSEDGPAAYAAFGQMMLAAEEVVALNRDRIEEIPPSDRSLLDEVAAEVQAAVTSLPPDHVGIRRNVEAYGSARRALLQGVRDVIALALNEMGATTRVVPLGPYLVGLVPNMQADGVPTRRHGVVLLSERAVRELLREQLDAARVERMGLALRIVPLEEATSGAAAVSRDLGRVDWLRIPYRAELVRTRPLDLPQEGPGELFYWGIITLAAGGLFMGAYVLSRLYTREVRLARLKADFVSNLSHELKTPLTSIGIFTEMLQDGQLQSEADRKEGLEVLAQEAQRLQGIVARMLEVARREARGVPYDLKPGDLNEVVQRATERFRRIVTESGLHLQADVASEALPLLMDAAAIDDVVTNLLTNAWKYRRGAEARITVATTRRGRRAELAVGDDGIGIPRRERRKVFEMFYRAEAYLTKVSGTGLGLSLVRTIVRAHRGSIRVETGDGGQGTRFRLRFPLTRATRTPSTSSLPVGSTTPSRSEAQATP